LSTGKYAANEEQTAKPLDIADRYPGSIHLPLSPTPPASLPLPLGFPYRWWSEIRTQRPIGKDSDQARGAKQEQGDLTRTVFPLKTMFSRDAEKGARKVQRLQKLQWA
jgi:hypothetical protein